MNKSSRVNKNDASDTGGGISQLSGIFIMNGSAAVIGNTAGVDGGGIYNCCGATTSGAIAGGNVRNNSPNDIAP
jgi:hypothetical protein